MALEDLISELNTNLKALSAQFAAAVGTTPTAAAPAAEETKPKSTKKADTKPAETEAPKSEGPTFAEVSEIAKKWIGEHPKGSDEQKARTAYLKSDIYPKLGVAEEGLKGMADKPDALAKFKTWLEGKAKTDLFGYGAGIFAKPAETEAPASEEDEL